MAEQVIEFVDLLNHPNYEILNVYPFTIRRTHTHRLTISCGASPPTI